MKIEKFANISKWIFTLNVPSVNAVIASHVYSEMKKQKDLKRFEFMQNLAQRTPYSLHQCYDVLSGVETDNLHEFENIFEGAMTINEIAVAVYNRRTERQL